MLRITLDAFSGRPNPTWILPPDESLKVLSELSQHRTAILESEENRGLGLRGAIIESLSDDLADEYGLPSTFSIGARAEDRSGKGLEILERLIKGMTRSVEKADDPTTLAYGAELQSSLLAQLQLLRISRVATVPDLELAKRPVEKETLATCQIEVGAFNPGFWNAAGTIGTNNCYNYGSNRRTNTFAQPGRGAGSQYTAITCPEVTRAAIADGLHKRFDCFPDTEKNRWLMALVVGPGYDYHWYRLQKNGIWGHKPGGTSARNYDNNGVVITNPQTCARGPYTDFCGYFYSCRTQQNRIR